jgi:3-dehydroquinate dehydratase-2
MANILVLQGPNLNLLGQREPQIYGSSTLEMVHDSLKQLAQTYGHTLTTFQSNAEADLIQKIQNAPKENADFIIINPAAFTHTSIALRDALLAVALPFIEVHLSNVHARESFRHHSYFSDIAVGVMMGFGIYGYELALQAADHYFKTHNKK